MAGAPRYGVSDRWPAGRWAARLRPSDVVAGGGMNGSIICGVDGSPGAQEALRVAAQLSGQLGSRLVVAHVTRRQVSGPDPAPPGIAPEEAEIAAAEHLVEE